MTEPIVVQYHIDGVALLNNPDYDELRLKAIGLGRQLIIKEAPDL